MSSRTVTAIIIYAVTVIIAYTVLRILGGLDDRDDMPLAWVVATVWPVFACVIIAYIPFYLIGTGIDKIIYSVQTRILEAKIHKR